MSVDSFLTRHVGNAVRRFQTAGRIAKKVAPVAAFAAVPVAVAVTASGAFGAAREVKRTADSVEPKGTSMYQRNLAGNLRSGNLTVNDIGPNESGTVSNMYKMGALFGPMNLLGAGFSGFIVGGGGKEMRQKYNLAPPVSASGSGSLAMDTAAPVHGVNTNRIQPPEMR